MKLRSSSPAQEMPGVLHLHTGVSVTLPRMGPPCLSSSSAVVRGAIGCYEGQRAAPRPLHALYPAPTPCPRSNSSTRVSNWCICVVGISTLDRNCFICIPTSFITPMNASKRDQTVLSTTSCISKVALFTDVVRPAQSLLLLVASPRELDKLGVALAAGRSNQQPFALLWPSALRRPSAASGPPDADRWSKSRVIASEQSHASNVDAASSTVREAPRERLPPPPEAVA